MDSSFYGPDLARIHHLGFGELAAEAAPFLIEQIRKHPAEGPVIDLGCGGGLLSRELTAAGFEVIGVDLSRDMVELARQTVPNGRFEAVAAWEFPFPRCRAVLAIGEVLSYLVAGAPADAAERVLREAGRALSPGGLLAFDLLTEGRPMAYRSWVDGEGWAVAVEVREPAETGIVVREIVAFTEAEGGLYRRSEETHVLRVSEQGWVVRMLEEMGFRVRTRRSWGRYRLPPRRTAFLARKER